MKKIQLSNESIDRIIIKLQLGKGYRNTFLNGIQIFDHNGQEATLIAEKSFSCCVYEKSYVISESEIMIIEFLKSLAAENGSLFDDSQLEAFSKSLVAEAMNNNLNSQTN
ncbi:MAG: hypothetical protein ACOYN4_13865 [Bacteroidales bacterium]